MAWMLNRSSRKDRERLLIAQLLRATNFANAPSDRSEGRKKCSSRLEIPLANDKYRPREAGADILRIDGNESRQRALWMMRRGLWQGGRGKGRLLADTPVSTLRLIPVHPGNAAFSLAYAINLPSPTPYLYKTRGHRNVTWLYFFWIRLLLRHPGFICMTFYAVDLLDSSVVHAVVLANFNGQTCAIAFDVKLSETEWDAGEQFACLVHGANQSLRFRIMDRRSNAKILWSVPHPLS